MHAVKKSPLSLCREEKDRCYAGFGADATSVEAAPRLSTRRTTGSGPGSPPASGPQTMPLMPLRPVRRRPRGPGVGEGALDQIDVTAGPRGSTAQGRTDPAPDGAAYAVAVAGADAGGHRNAGGEFVVNALLTQWGRMVTVRCPPTVSPTSLAHRAVALLLARPTEAAPLVEIEACAANAGTDKVPTSTTARPTRTTRRGTKLPVRVFI